MDFKPEGVHAMNDAHPTSTDRDAPKKRLSYKFQRLRERLRQAILSGELSGKLPGERQLAERFNANAKTLSKALTDLAAEGLLERTIGRGTFVRGSAEPTTRSEKWLLLCDTGRTDHALVRLLMQACPDSHVATDVSNMRPSFLSQFTAVVDMASNTPESFLRDMVVRNGSVVLAGREPSGYSMNAVVVDTVLGAACAGRELLTAGHRHITVIERQGHNTIEQSLRKTAQRFAQDTTIEARPVDELEAAMENGTTAFVCDAELAGRVMQTLHRMGLATPGQVSVLGVGCIESDYPCSGYFVTPVQMCEAIVSLIRESNKRPQTLWLVGASVDRSTMGTVLTPLTDQPYVVMPRLAM